MKTVTEKELSENLSNTFDQVIVNSAPILIKRKDEDCVIMSAQEYRGIQETLYLLSSPKNAERLLKGVEEARTGKTIVHEIDEL